MCEVIQASDGDGDNLVMGRRRPRGNVRLSELSEDVLVMGTIHYP